MDNSKNQDNEKVDLPSDLLVLKEERQVILHGIAKGNQLIQIQGRTTITCYKNHKASKLLFSFGVPIYPEFSEGKDQKFTLIFEGLPANCTKFYYQSVPNSGGWRCYEFEKNTSGVYYFEIE